MAIGLENFVCSAESNEKISRRSFLIGALSAIFLGNEGLFNESEASRKNGRRIDYPKLKIPRLGYTPRFHEPDMRGIQLASNDTHIGRVQRAARWRNISRAVEKRYNVPRDYLLGMICVESEGDPTQPNLGNDGGVGLIHMQPVVAASYGLRLIDNSKKLVDYRQGRKIDRTIDLHNGDLKDLIKLDDRFHPVMNIDAAGRMLADHYQRRKSWNDGFRRFSGRKTYGRKVIGYVRKLHSTRFMSQVR